MQLIHHRIGAVLVGLVAAAVLAVLMAGQAQAATTTVEIVQTAKPNAGGTKEVTLGVVKSTLRAHAFKKHPAGVNSNLTWIKRDNGSNFAIYESVKLPGQCLEARSNISGDGLYVGPCTNFLARQKWTQGFDTAPFRKFTNLESGYALTSAFGNNINGNVVQQLDQGLATQKWRVRPV